MQRTPLPEFPTPFPQQSAYGSGSEACTVLELELMALMGAIKEKPEWVCKVHDSCIVSKWRDEAGVSDELFSRAILELQGVASAVRDDVRPSPVDGVYESDAAVPDAVRMKLVQGVLPLENVDDEMLDWHPGSDQQVLDLVHPSLHCYVHGYSRVAAAEGQQWAAWVGSGIPAQGVAASMSPQARNSVTPPISPAVSSLSDHREPREQDEYTSAKYQWLPSDISVAATGDVTIDSYINNLHPELHSGLYDTLAVLIGAFVPLWSAVLTEAASEPQERVAVGMYDLWEPFEFEYQEEGADEDEAYEAWAESRQMVNGPVLNAWDASREVQRVDLCGRQLQVIVKLANIELTPEKPTYSGGTWHVEGMRNEAIVCSGIYYFASENISESRLSFRKAICEPSYEQDDRQGVDCVYGLQDQSPLNQQIGSVVACEGRCIAFPNTLQHRVQPFGLTDPSKPGKRQICALFLVDPNQRILSTSSVPPQQQDWLRKELMSMHRFAQMPSGVLSKVLRLLDYPMPWSLACEYREKLMHERSTFVDQHTEDVFQRPFSLCEH